MTTDNSIATKNSRTMRPAKTNLSRQRISMLQQTVQPATKTKEDYVATFTKDCCDTEFSLSSASQQDSVATKEISVMTKVEKNHQSMSQHIKECYNKVEELEEETSVATKENYVTTKYEDERIEDCLDKEIYVATEFKAAKNDKLCCNKVLCRDIRHSCRNIK